MVAVTVFLAATVGIGVQSFASDVAGGTPQHGFSFETQDDGDVRIESTGGGAIDAEDVTVLVDGSTATMNQSFSGEIKAGSVAEAKDVSSGATVTVRWSDGEDSTVLATWETP